jgi:crotonobetainyl-CoA hydratase
MSNIKRPGLNISKHGPVLQMLIDRPKANAINAATSRQMSEAFVDFEADPDLRVAILSGSGERFFSAGWDLKSAADGEAFEADYGSGGFGGLSEFHDRTKPVIAAVNGMAVGGGFELALACDLILAAEHAEFFLTEVFLGIIPDSGSLRLPRQLPRQIANELLMTGRRMPAQEAARWGLVNSVHPSASLLDEAHTLATTIAEAAPLSLAAVLEITAVTHGQDLKTAYASMRAGANYQKMLASEDAQEGPRAFAEKRSPIWKGK